MGKKKQKIKEAVFVVMFHVTAKLFLDYLIKFDEYQPLSPETHEVLNPNLAPYISKHYEN